MKNISFIFCILLLVGCTTSKSILVDIKTPSSVIFPISVAKIAIVDNSAQSHPDPNIEPTRYSVQTSKKTFLNALVQFINDENFFTSAHLDTIPLRSDSIINNLHLLNPNKAIQVIQKNQVDAIITLDIYDIESEPILIEDYNFKEYFVFKYINAVMSVYGSDGKRSTNTFVSTSDSIYQLQAYDIPINQDIIHNMVMNIADNTTKILLPYWEKQERLIFKTGTKNDKLANINVKENDWEGAVLLWDKDFKIEKSDNKKSKLAANIALCNEMLVNLDLAIEWIESSKKLCGNRKNTYSKTLVWYGKQLDERKKNFPKLQEQLTGN